MRIEPGDETERLGRERGWTYWHHLFNPRQLLLAALVNSSRDARLKFGLTQLLNSSARLSRWSQHDGGGGAVKQVFDNQALNTLFNYGARASRYALDLVELRVRSFPLDPQVGWQVVAEPADQVATDSDLYITDPPYGDAVKYEEILEFFIAWLRKNPPPEFADWVWDSRRALAIKGEDEDFRRGMVAAYSRMTDYMPDNGIQVIMFTHQSGTIWADMANIVWASGLHVTAAWYVVTETDSALREGSNVKGTVLLVLPEARGHGARPHRDDLAWDIQEEVEEQVAALTGLNQQAKGLYRDENVFEDADIQMAGYAAALRVLTRYAVIDGRDMTAGGDPAPRQGRDDVRRPPHRLRRRHRQPVPRAARHREALLGPTHGRRALLSQDARHGGSRGARRSTTTRTSPRRSRFATSTPFMGDHRANHARLKSAVEFGRGEMSEGSELYDSVLRAVLYAVMELVKQVDGAEVLAHLTLNVPDYYGDATQRDAAIALADYLARQLQDLRPDEAAGARVLRELIQTSASDDVPTRRTRSGASPRGASGSTTRSSRTGFAARSPTTASPATSAAPSSSSSARRSPRSRRCRSSATASWTRRTSLVSKHVRETALKERWNDAVPEVEALLHRDRYRRLYELLTQRSGRGPGRAQGPRLHPRQGRGHRAGRRHEDRVPRLNQRDQERLRPKLRDPLGGHVG